MIKQKSGFSFQTVMVMLTVLLSFFTVYQPLSAQKTVKPQVTNRPAAGTAVNAPVTNIKAADTTPGNSNLLPGMDRESAEPMQERTTPSGSRILFDHYDEVSVRNIDAAGLTEITFSGDVRIRFDNNYLNARVVIVTAHSNSVLELSAFDNVEFRYGQDIYLSDQLSFVPDKKQGLLKNVRSYMKGGNAGPISGNAGWFYQAKKATIHSEDRVTLEDVAFTFNAADIPHYELFAQRLWYLKGDMMAAVNLTYTVGQGNFIYFPVFLRFERGSGINTSFGNERRIGYYMMNSYNFNTSFASFNTGLDIYERLGEYFFADLRSLKPFGPFQTLSLNFQTADDVRVLFQNDRYVQLVPDENGILTNIRQWSWYYRLNGSITTNNWTMNLNWEDLNDPFFQIKYNQRRTAFDFKELLQPDQNSFYGTGRSDAQPNVSELNRGFSLGYGAFALSGSWKYNRTVDPSISNIYLNSRYKYMLSTSTFPTLSYNFGSIPILSGINSSVPVTITVRTSNTNITVPLDHDLAFIMITNPMLTNTTGIEPQTENADMSNTALITNIPESPVTQAESDSNTNSPQRSASPAVPVLVKDPSAQITTNYLVLYSLDSAVSASLSYTTSEQFDSNALTVMDQYSHSEGGALTFNTAFLNRLLTWNNSLDMRNQKYWSSYTNNATNNFNSSGQIVSFRSALGLDYTLQPFSGTVYGFSVPLFLRHDISQELIRTTYSLSPLYATHNTSLGFSLNYSNLVTYNFSTGHSIKYRLSNIETDNYKDNVIEQNLNLAFGTLRIWQFSFSFPGISLSILSTKTNTFDWGFDSLTNSMSPRGSFPVSASFASPMVPIPSLSYSYDLLRGSNINFSVSIPTITVKDLYNILVFSRVETFSFGSTLFWDFYNPRNIVFNMNFSTTLWFNKFWKLTFSTAVKNTRIYRYVPEYAARYNETPKDFFTDLWESLNISDYEGLKRGFFKIQNLHFGLVHFLNEWEMQLNFDINRRVDNQRLISYWEPVLAVNFKLTGSTDQFPPYERKFVPAEYQ